jgi:prepilin-type N-terminal cleavage/methylation domain-containing protein
MRFKSNHQGFTIIELLVVVAIVSIVASIVMINLNSSRLKARDTSIKAEVRQLRNLIELDFSETGSYANLQPLQWYATANDCATLGALGGNHVAQFRNICRSIVTKSANPTWAALGAGDYRLIVSNASSTLTRFSINVALVSKNAFYCLGNGGATSEVVNPSPGTNFIHNPGCYANPQP